MDQDSRGGPWNRLARLVLKRSLGLRRGQSVIIDGRTSTLGMAETIALEARKLGIRPVLLHECVRPMAGDPGYATPWDAYARGRAELAAAEACDGYIYLHPGLEEHRFLASLSPIERRALIARQMDWKRALGRHAASSVLLLGAGITAEGARAWGVDFVAWKRESLRGSMVRPSELRREGKSLARHFIDAKRVTILHPNGTHLALGLLGRTPMVQVGAVERQERAIGQTGTVLPAGLLTVALDENVAEGSFISNRPSRHHEGPISGITWTFRAGQLVRYDIRRGRDIFENQYQHAGRERSRPALLTVGLNPEIRNFPFAEDEQSGVITLEIGHNDDFGGRTRGRFRQFALLRGADLLIDDQTVLRAGRRP